MYKLNERIFGFVHGMNLVYNTCWEDPRLDREALRLSDSDTVAVITSAGCNALDYLLAGVKRVLAVDMNPRQNALLELKAAAARNLSYEMFFGLFGRGFLPDFTEVYRKQLRNELSGWSRKYWDNHSHFFDNPTTSFYFRGTSGFFARSINLYIDRVAKLREQILELLSKNTLLEQQNFYDQEVAPQFWNGFIRWFMRRDSTLALLGVPQAQRSQLERYYCGGIAKFVEDAVTMVFRQLPLYDNYFWRVYLTGGYTSSCCPEYLKENNFDELRSRLNEGGSLSIATSSLRKFLHSYEGNITKYVLLDHMDWLHHSYQDELVEEWQEIVNHAGKDCRVIWRSGGLDVDFVDPIMVKVHDKYVRVGELLNYDRELASTLHAQDRVHTYGNFFIASLAA